MAADFSVRGDTRLDATGFNSGLKKLAGIAAKGLAVVGTASATAISAIAAAGVKYNASMEQYQTAFKTMLGNAEAADALTGSLKTLAAQTPLAMSDLADASKTLLAFGTSAEKLPGTLKKLGDVALGDAKKLGTMATAFGRIQSNGRASMEEINMMIDQGFNPLNIIAEKTGETMEDVRKRVSDGGVSFGELSDALDVATSKGGQFYNAMQEQSKTFAGMLSTLKDNALSFAGDLSSGVSKALAKTAMPMVNGWLGDLQAAFDKGGVAQVVESMGGVLADASLQVAKAIPGVATLSVSFVRSFISGIVANTGQLAEAALEITKALVGGLISLLPVEIQAPVREAMDSIAATIERGGVKKAITALAKLFKNLSKEVGNIAKMVLPPLTKAFGLVADNLDVLVPLTIAAVAGIKGFQIASAVATKIGKLQKSIAATAAATTAETLATTASTGALTLKQVAVGVLTGKIGLVTAAQQLWNAVMNANPIGLMITAVAGLATGIAALTLCTRNEVEETDAVWEAHQKRTESMQALTDSYRQSKEAAAAAATQDLVQVENAQRLYNELQTLVDANGNVTEANRARVQFILNELNSALGTEYSLTGTQIAGYRNLQGEIQKTIEMKRAEVLLTAYEDDYRNALENRAEAERTNAQNYIDLQEQRRLADDLSLQYSQSTAEKEAAIADGTIDYWWTLNGEKYTALEDRVNKESAKLDELEKSYDDSSAALKDYYATIATYEEANTSFLDGDSAKVVELLGKQSSSFKEARDVAVKSATEQKEELGQQYADTLTTLEQFLDGYSKGLKGFDDARLKELQQQAEDAKIEAEKVGANIVDGTISGANGRTIHLQKTIESIFSKVPDWANDALDIHSPSRVMRDKVGKWIPEGAAVGVKMNTDSAVASVQSMAAEMVKAGEAAAAQSQYRAAIWGRGRSIEREATNAVSSTTNTQNIYFEQPMQAPDEIARELRIQQTYGLAGAR